MAKFIVVKEIPKNLGKGEIVIDQPTFLDQIRENAKKAPRVKQTAINHLREVINAIGVKFDPELNVFKFKLVNYEGLPYKDEIEFSKILNRILRTEYPQIFEKYLEYQLKNRPMGTKLVYYIGDFGSTGPFYSAGLDLLEEKDLESYLTGTPKKTVGKPAVTNKEAAEPTKNN